MNVQNAIKFIILHGFVLCATISAAPLAFVENNHEIVVKREINDDNGILKRINRHADETDDSEIFQTAETQIFRPKLQKFTNRVRKSAYTSDTHLSPYYFTINYPISYSFEPLHFWIRLQIIKRLILMVFTKNSF